MSNPLVQQGTINRLRVHVAVPSYSTLNVSPGYVGRGGVTMALAGDATMMIDTMTGLVTSPEPFLSATINLHLLRSQNLAALWRAQMESTSTIGDVTIHTDTSVDPDYTFRNCAIMSVGEINYAGGDPGYMVTVQGIYDINSSLWSAV